MAVIGARCDGFLHYGRCLTSESIFTSTRSELK